MTLREKIGQRLMTGFPGTEMSEEFKNAVRTCKIGNVILFQENVRDCEQLKQLCSDIQTFVRAETGHSALIAIDQEGGVVTRMREDGVNVPGAMALGAAGDPENARRAGRLIGRELRHLGVNFNFAPTVDVNSNPQNPVIGVRSYGDDPKKVGLFAEQAVKGLKEGGVLCAAKHFPGHGDTDLDSHLALPCVNKSLEQLEQVELVPFRAAVRAGVPAVMTAHILFPQLEPQAIPATMSRRIIQGLLRKKLGFDGLVVSDCMQMAAIASHYGTVEGTLASFQAGVDLVEITHDPTLCAKAAERVLQAAESGELDMKELDESVDRILALKKHWIDDAQTPDFDFESASRTSHELMEKTITELNRPAGLSAFPGEHPLCIGCSPYRVSLVGNVGTGQQNLFGRQMALELDGTAAVMTQNPTPEEVRELTVLAKQHGSAVVGTYNAHLREGQLALVRSLADSGIPLAVVALRNPYDLRGLPNRVWSIAAYEYSENSIQAAARVLRGELWPTGKLPVKL